MELSLPLAMMAAIAIAATQIEYESGLAKREAQIDYDPREAQVASDGYNKREAQVEYDWAVPQCAA